MFKKTLPSFYNPKLDTQTTEERFLLKRRIRLMNKLDALDKDDKWYWSKYTKITKQLKQTEEKLGIKQ
jgi:hypothetical protein